MFTLMRSLVSWFWKSLQLRPDRCRAPRRLLPDVLEDRLAPAGLPIGPWPTYEQNNMRTGAVGAAVIAGPTVLWENGPFGPQGSRKRVRSVRTSPGTLFLTWRHFDERYVSTINGGIPADTDQ